MNVNKARFFWFQRYLVLLSCFLGLVISSSPTFAGGVFNANSAGSAINGYDPVAYFTMDQAVKGTKDFTHEWLDVTWYFANEEHRDLFAADPTRYAPQHGGYCSAGAIDGDRFSADPKAWRIVDNRLYLFYRKSTAARWDPDKPRVIEVNAGWQQKLADIIQ